MTILVTPLKTLMKIQLCSNVFIHLHSEKLSMLPNQIIYPCFCKRVWRNLKQSRCLITSLVGADDRIAKLYMDPARCGKSSIILQQKRDCVRISPFCCCCLINWGGRGSNGNMRLFRIKIYWLWQTVI